MPPNEVEQAPTLLGAVRAELRRRHYSRATETAYVGWVRRYIRFHGRRHPRDMGEREVAAFLTWLASELRVCASTQNQALSALRFLYRDVLELPFSTGDAAGGAAR